MQRNLRHIRGTWFITVPPCDIFFGGGMSPCPPRDLRYRLWQLTFGIGLPVTRHDRTTSVPSTSSQLASFRSKCGWLADASTRDLLWSVSTPPLVKPEPTPTAGTKASGFNSDTWPVNMQHGHTVNTCYKHQRRHPRPEYLHPFDGGRWTPLPVETI